MKPADKEEEMRRFAAGKTNIMVACCFVLLFFACSSNVRYLQLQQFSKQTIEDSLS
jgi:hypothetical protein